MVFGSDIILLEEISLLKKENESSYINFIYRTDEGFRIILILEEKNYPYINENDILLLKYTYGNKKKCVKFYPAKPDKKFSKPTVESGTKATAIVDTEQRCSCAFMNIDENYLDYFKQTYIINYDDNIQNKQIIWINA